jgi:hypothetical protein
MQKRRKDIYRLRVTKVSSLRIHDKPGHTLTLTELEGEPIEYEVGVAGEFISRRNVTFHDRTKGTGPLQGYSEAHFQNGTIYSAFQGHRDGSTKISKGTWKVYKSAGKLEGIQGQGTFTLKAGKRMIEFIMEMEGEYEAA